MSIPRRASCLRDRGRPIRAAAGDERGASGQIHALRLYPVCPPLMFMVRATWAHDTHSRLSLDGRRLGQHAGGDATGPTVFRKRRG